MPFSPDQEKIVQHSQGSLLVSAAAGSGKTTTMVGHVLKRLESLHIEELVLLTYTRPAAAEMRQRIMDALTAALEKDPENAHLRRQLYGVPLAVIGTIDSFCMGLVRDHFDRLDLTPDIRIADEKEMGLLKDGVLEELLEEAYEEGRESFLALRSRYSSEKNHDSLKEIILNLYEVSQNDADPPAWLRSCLRQYGEEPVALAALPWMQAFYRRGAEGVARCLEQARSLERLFIGDDKVLALLARDIEIMEALLAEEDRERMLLAIPGLKFPARPAKLEEENKHALDRFRGTLKGSGGYLASLYGLGASYRGLEAEWALLKLTEEPLRELVDLTLTFGERLEKRCQEKGITDFAGLEHYALDLLTEKDEDGAPAPTELALELRQRYKEVIVDEYQDVNQIQEYILQALGGPNLFMVGDVKQSIYRFRRAKPSIFVDKYLSFSQEPESPGRRIDLKENFRSRREILEGANELFGALMSRETGGVDYDEKAALKPAAAYQGPGAQPLAVLIETESQAAEGAREQARYIAGEIRRLMQEGFQVYEPKEMQFRPLSLKDVVILLRKKKRARLLARELESFGIPATYPHKSGFYERREVRTMLALLAVLDNPRQDIPLGATLLAPFGGFSEEALADMRRRTGDMRSPDLWDRLLSLEEDPRIQVFLERIRGWRRLAAYRPLPELIQDLFEQSGFEEHLRAHPQEGSPANIRELVRQAREFERIGGGGLYPFLLYIEQQKKLKLEDRGEAEQMMAGVDAVRIDSIHASKGLEFPVVFLAGCEAAFDHRDSEGDYFTDEQEGIALKSVDLEQYVKTHNLAWLAVQDRVRGEALSEEIRLLYVAMTRAKERFYLLGRCKDVKKEAEKVLLPRPPADGKLPPALVREQKSYLSLYLAAHEGGCLPHFPMITLQAEALPKPEDLAEEIPLLTEMPRAETEGVPWPWQDAEAEEDKPYPFALPEGMKAAYSVSELKELEKVREGAMPLSEEKAAKEKALAWAEIPAAEGAGEELARLGGADRGTLYHRVMEHLPWEQGESREGIEAFLEAALERGLFKPEDVRQLDTQRIRDFFAQPVGRRSLAAYLAGKLRREQPFLLGVPYREIRPEDPSEETVLVQGIIDLFFEEKGKLILVDYKTDRGVSPQVLAERHGQQLAWYARALKAARNQPVEEIYIYSFFLGEFVRVYPEE